MFNFIQFATNSDILIRNYFNKNERNFMGLPRAFVGFSSTDIGCFRLMKAWKANTKFDFNFADFQIEKAINSENEEYIKSLIRKRINMSGTFISLIGADTKSKHKFVRWEMEVALEKNCRIIGVNLNGSRNFDNVRCPPILKNKGVIFLPFSPNIIAYALENFQKKEEGNLVYKDSVYRELGYE